MKQTIRLTQNDLNKIITESVELLLNEGDWAMDPRIGRELWDTQGLEGMRKNFPFYARTRPRDPFLNDTSTYRHSRSYGDERDVKKSISQAEKELKSGKNPSKVFDSVDISDLQKYGMSKVRVGKLYNILTKNGQLLSKQWFDKIDSYDLLRYGLCTVTLNDKQNIISKKGQLLFNQWFDKINSYYLFKYGFGPVTLDGKQSIVSKKGELLSKQWFDEIDFYDLILHGFCIVTLSGKQNLISKNGQLLSKQWFDDIDSYHLSLNGIGTVTLNGKQNIISKNGQLLSKQWFDEIRHVRGLKFAGFVGNKFTEINLNKLSRFKNFVKERFF